MPEYRIEYTVTDYDETIIKAKSAKAAENILTRRLTDQSVREFEITHVEERK